MTRDHFVVVSYDGRRSTRAEVFNTTLSLVKRRATATLGTTHDRVVITEDSGTTWTRGKGDRHWTLAWKR